MEISRPMLNAQEMAALDRTVGDFNLSIGTSRQPQQGLGKDDFLKILITQLSYQDPTAPMDDKQFIAQMAQFSTLEQMTAISGDFARLTSMLLGSEASSSLGKNVEIIDGERVMQGTVQAVTRGEIPQVLVNGNFYNWELVSKVFAE